MASLSVVIASARKHALAAGASSRVFVPATKKNFHASSRKESSACGGDAVKQGVDSVKNAAASAHETVAKEVDEKSETISEVAGNIKDKAKQTAEDAWGSVKDTTQKIKETVVGKAEDSKESIKETAKTVERSMNTKKDL